MSVILQCENICRSFGAVVAADRINISVDKTDILGVIGANGAGKTTFINIVTGYLKPDSGALQFAGKEITGLAVRKIARLGICRSFQIPQLFPQFTVIDNMLTALCVATEGGLAPWRPARTASKIRAARAILERYGIESYGDQLALTLPQGIRKLLDIAMATVGDPKLVLLDEPTSGISVDEKFGIMDTLMSALQDQGATVIFVEHDMEIIERYATRVAAFFDGRIIADGSPKKVLRDADVREYVVGTELHRRKVSAK